MKLTKNIISMFLTLKYGENIKKEDILYHRKYSNSGYYLHSIFIRDVGVYEAETHLSKKFPFSEDWDFFDIKIGLQRRFFGRISKKFLQKFVEMANIYKRLVFIRAKIKDVSVFTKLSYLEELSFYNNNISNIDPIKNMEHLKVLDLRKNPISLENIKELSSCLTQLKIVSDYGEYKNMEKLEQEN